MKEPGEWTVGDLIEELSKHSPLLKVQRDDGEYGDSEIVAVDFICTDWIGGSRGRVPITPRVVIR